jgi:hypothetical protein
LRNQLCCICTKIGDSDRSSRGPAGGAEAGTVGIAASAAPQPLFSRWAGTTGTRTGTGALGTAAAGAGGIAIGDGGALTASIVRPTRLGSGGRSAVGRTFGSGRAGGRCDGKAGNAGCTSWVTVSGS